MAANANLRQLVFAVDALNIGDGVQRAWSALEGNAEIPGPDALGACRGDTNDETRQQGHELDQGTTFLKHETPYALAEHPACRLDRALRCLRHGFKALYCGAPLGATLTNPGRHRLP